MVEHKISFLFCVIIGKVVRVREVFRRGGVKDDIILLVVIFESQVLLVIFKNEVEVVHQFNVIEHLLVERVESSYFSGQFREQIEKVVRIESISLFMEMSFFEGRFILFRGGVVVDIHIVVVMVDIIVNYNSIKILVCFFVFGFIFFILTLKIRIG